MTCRACLIMTTVIASLAVDGCDHGAPAEGEATPAPHGHASAVTPRATAVTEPPVHVGNESDRS